jgi:hypothetical protein
MCLLRFGWFVCVRMSRLEGLTYDPNMFWQASIDRYLVRDFLIQNSGSLNLSDDERRRKAQRLAIFEDSVNLQIVFDRLIFLAGRKEEHDFAPTNQRGTTMLQKLLPQIIKTEADKMR